MGFGTLQEREQRVLDRIQVYEDSGIQDQIDQGNEMNQWVYYNDVSINNEFNQAISDAANSPTQENFDKLSGIKEVVRLKYPEFVEPYLYTDGVILD